MVKRKHYDQSHKESVVAEILGGTSVAAISQWEGIAAHTLYNWREKIASGDFSDSHRTEIELRKRIRELEGALGEFGVLKSCKALELGFQPIITCRFPKKMNPKLLERSRIGLNSTGLSDTLQ